MDGSTGYLFLTSKNLVYNITFDGSLYSNYLDAYPYLLQNGYGISFFPTSNLVKHSFDPKVSTTVQDIALDFIEIKGDDAFILYHCDFRDKRQTGRDKLFNQWFAKCAANERVHKHGLEVQIEKNNGETEYHYIGFLTMATNKNIDAAVIELKQFSRDLVNENVNKSR